MTLATNNQYAHGVIALGKALRNTGTERDLVAMITDGVSEDMRSVLSCLCNSFSTTYMHFMKFYRNNSRRYFIR